MNNQVLSCTHCPRRSNCKAPCAAVEALLPKEHSGELRRLRRSGGRLFAQELEHRRAWVRLLLDWRHHLVGRPRQVFDLHFNEGLTHGQIARELGLNRATVSEYLSRAKDALQVVIDARIRASLSEPQ